MSLSMYRGQVDRLTKEIADLQAKMAEEHDRAARERGAALAAASSITKHTSESTARSKLSEQARRLTRAAQHDKTAAGLAGRLAEKRRALTTAQGNVERAEAAERRRQEEAADRRRRDDLRHITELERRRRAAAASMLAEVSPLQTGRRMAREDEGPGPTFEYDVCLSFAGEQRGYVELVAAALRERGLRVLYDQDEQVKLWGKDLAEHLDQVYRIASRYCVMFVSKDYGAKAWTRHERRSALARALADEGEYVLPARFDETELPGLRPTIAYLDLREIAPATLAAFILEKVTGGAEAGGGVSACEPDETEMGT